MKRFFLSFIIILVICLVLPLKAQDLIRNSSVTGICYAGKKVNRIYIPPPEEFFSKSGKKGNASVTIYYSGFSDLAKTAMEKARLILEAMLPADAKVTISASWEKISTDRVLANSSITGYVGGWAVNALNPVAIYPVALAEKIWGRSINDDPGGDMLLTINNSINWYLGTDGQTPVTKYDLITVALHEICHGLGFFDSMNTDGTIGWYGSNSIPMIYDTFIENNSGKRLTDTLAFLNYSASLKNQITGGHLYFNGPVLSHYASGGKAKLWAPSVFDAGSSISHLDEDSTLKENSLMTPYIDLGEAIHDPGKLTFSILGDLGWINTRLVHQAPKDTEEHLADILLSAKIESDTSYNRDRVGVVFSFNNFSSSDTLFMTSPNSDDIFNTIINIPSYNTELQYYFFVEDHFMRIFRSPSFIELFRYKIYIGTDTVKPVISHTRVKYYLETIDTISFNAAAVDNIGVDSVYLEYKVNNGTLNYLGLKAGKSDRYSASINAKKLNLNGGDSIKYRIFAIDSALSPNIAVLPEDGYFVIPVEGVGTLVESYATDFTNASADFFNIGFNISKPVDFSKFGLHTRHPYESPEVNNRSIEYTAMLRHLLKFNESGMFINFSEIVLVEPGEPGSVFGSPDFYDYVILEGSKNFGKTWFPLVDGYDSRFASSWEAAYNNSVVGQNSTLTGNESMLRKHTIYYKPSDNISAGDTMLLRFRLYSDPFANGWGWVIEDLKINPLVDAIEKRSLIQTKVYPNPGNGLIKISTYLTGSESREPIRYSVLNSAGTYILRNNILNGSETFLDISGFPAGLYIIVLYRDVGMETFKYSLIK